MKAPIPASIIFLNKGLVKFVDHVIGSATPHSTTQISQLPDAVVFAQSTADVDSCVVS